MLMNQTIEKLNYMKLFGIVKGMEEQRTNPEFGSLSFEERLSFLIEREWVERDNRKLQRLLKEARLKCIASLEGVDYNTSRGLDRSLVATLSGFDWILQNQSIIITGATGTGKTYLSCAFGNGACRRGHRSVYLRVPKLFEELRTSRVDGSYMRFMAKIARTRLLILDDFGLSAMNETQSKDFLEVIEECTNKCSVIVAGQLPLKNWHETISNPTVADAILDRLVHNSYKFNLKGESMRKKTGLKTGVISDTM